jgi:hypothetical protein
MFGVQKYTVNSAALGEASYVLAEALSRLLLVVAQLPLLARAHVGALEVPDKDPM